MWALKKKSTNGYFFLPYLGLLNSMRFCLMPFSSFCKYSKSNQCQNVVISSSYNSKGGMYHQFVYVT